jgi:hypothetical protein
MVLHSFYKPFCRTCLLYSTPFALQNACDKMVSYKTGIINYYLTSLSLLSYLRFPLTFYILFCYTYRVSQKWRTNGALRCRRDYRKHQKNVKKILLDSFADLAVFESGT